MIIFMLIMSIGLMTTYRYVGAKQNQDMAQHRVDNSVVTTDGAIQADARIIISKADLVEAVKYNKSIENQVERLGLEDDEIHGIRKVTYYGTELTLEDAMGLPDTNYVITYDKTEISVRSE